MSDTRLIRFLEAAGGDLLVSADPGLVRMLTGHAPDLRTGPSPFALPAVVVAPGDGPARLVCAAEEAPASPTTHTYTGATRGPLNPIGGATVALHAALAAAAKGRALIDTATLPAALAAAIDDTAPAGPALAHLPAVKSDQDIVAVEAVIRLSDAGHAAARHANVPGATELDLWDAALGAVERGAGAPTMLAADMVSGPRTEQIGGFATARRIGADDPVLCDLGPRHDGIWGDSCATWVIGEPEEDVRTIHAAASAALEAGLAALRPGAVAGEIDARVRGVMADAGCSYPHHTGHGVGFHRHEEPRIVPGGETVLEPGMVIALEPGAYRDGHGVRVEQVALVTADGCRVLSGHSLALAADE